MTKLLRIATSIMCVLMFAIVVGQVYMWEGRRQGRQEFTRQVQEMEARLAEVEAQLKEEEDERLNYLVYRIITCESGRRHDVWGDAGKAFGVAQFHRATFFDMAKKAGLRNADWHNEHQQILLLKWALWQGVADKHWVRCYREAMG